MNNVGELLDSLIKERIDFLYRNKENNNIEYIQTDNFGEILEKLIILHVRVWRLEDKINENYHNNDLVADLKRKIDICFKQKRPKFIQAINKLIDDTILNNKSL